MLDQNQINQFTTRAKAKGYSDAQIAAEIERKKKETQVQTVIPTSTPSPTPGMDISSTTFSQPKPVEKPSPAGFINNIFKSGWNTGKDIVKAGINVFNPDMEKNTIANLGRLGAGAVQLAVPGEQKQEKYAKAVGNFYDERYGISNLFKGDVGGFKKKVGKTIYEDPVGFALDASIILGGAGTVVKGVGTVSKSSKLAKAGSILTKAGETIDPLRAASKVVGKAGIGEKVTKAGEVIEKGGKKAGLRAIKAAPTTDIANFQDDIGRALDSFQATNKLYGSTEQILQKTKDLITGNQTNYNKLVRTGQKVPVADYVSLLKNKAAEMKVGNLSPEVDATADALMAKAKAIEKLAGKEKLVAIDSIVDAKGASFGGVNPTTMRDAAALNADKIAGGIGIEYLDNFAPGSAEIGKELQALRAFEDIVKKRAGKGEGSQLINVHKGGVVGASVGSIVGGGIPGMVAGYAVGEAVNSPRVLSVISQGTQKLGRGVQKLPGVAEKAGAVTKPAVISSRLTPNLEFAGGQPAFSETLPVAPSASPVVPGADTTGKLPFSPPPAQGATATGYTVQQHLQALSQATAAGDTQAVKQIKAQLAIEEKYQKEGGAKGKAIPASQAVPLSDYDAAISVMDEVDTELTNNPKVFDPILGRLGGINPYATQAQTTQAIVNRAAQVVGKALEGGVLRKEDEVKYRKQLPQITDTLAVAKAKAEKIRAMLVKNRQQKIDALVKAGYDPEMIDFSNGTEGVTFGESNPLEY